MEKIEPTHEKVDVQKLIAHLSAKWQNRPCPMCGVRQWNVQERPFELREFYGGGLLVGGAIVPVIPVICGNCGNTVLINTIVAGLAKPEGEKNE